MIHLETYGNTILVSIGRVEFVSALCSCFLFYFVLFNQEVYGRLFKTNKKRFKFSMLPWVVCLFCCCCLSYLILFPRDPIFLFKFFLFVVTSYWKHWLLHVFLKYWLWWLDVWEDLHLVLSGTKLVSTLFWS